MSLSKPLTLRHLCHLLNNILGLFYHRHIVFLAISLVKNTKYYLPKKSAPQCPRNKLLATTCCAVLVVLWCWCCGGGAVVVVRWCWCCGGGAMVVVLWWWCCGGGAVVVVLWWWWTPNHLLTMKSKVILPPPGIFQRADIYSRKRWRRVQYLIDEFWYRWRSEFLQSLQVRQKWMRPRNNLTVGDVVIVKDIDTPRNRWKLARIVETFPENDGLVRKVKVALADSTLDDKGRRKRPISYLD